MPLTVEIREQLARYLVGQMTLGDFTEWFLSASWNVNKREPAASDLVYSVELQLENYSDWGDEAELRRSLHRVLENYVVASTGARSTPVVLMSSAARSMLASLGWTRPDTHGGRLASDGPRVLRGTAAHDLLHVPVSVAFGA
jgi:hypothetical protein